MSDPAEGENPILTLGTLLKDYHVNLANGVPGGPSGGVPSSAQAKMLEYWMGFAGCLLQVLQAGGGEGEGEGGP